MRSQFLLVILYFLSSIATAQVPQGISYQAVARNGQGQPLANLPVKVRFSILDSSAVGPVVYTETHEPVTSAAGLITVTIGTGDSNPIPFSTIQWEKNSKFLKVELDTTASGNSYLDLGTQQMMSVPYALYAGSSSTLRDVILPTISTDSINNLTFRSALASATVLTSGNKPVLMRGVCVDTIPLPNDANAKGATGTSTGSYSVELVNLLPGKTYYIRAFATSTGGTVYGSQLSFTTLSLSAPVVETDTVIVQNHQAAIAKGKLLSEGGLAVNERGFCWSTNNNPTINDNYLFAANDSLFSTFITGLMPGQTYYLKAFAINLQGISYGATTVFTTPQEIVPEIITLSVTDIKQRTATGNARLVNSNGFTISKRGICLASHSLPDTNDIVIYYLNNSPVFSVDINNLNPTTTYYAKTFVIYSNNITYGNTVSFTTLALTLPDITTIDISGISSTTANGGGIITADGGDSITVKGLCWSTNPNPTITDFNSDCGAGSANFNAVLSNLVNNTLYYVRAYATNSIGTAYGNLVTFTTTNSPVPQPGLPTVGTGSVNKTFAEYVGTGYVSNDGGSSIIQRGFCWNTNGNPTISDSIIVDDSTGIGFFNTSFFIQSPCNITYYVKAFAINASGVGYGNQVSLKSGLVVSFQVPVITSNTGTTASVNSAVIDEGGCSIIERGICWSVNPNPTILFSSGLVNPFHSSAGSGLGNFAVEMFNLVPNTTYYIRSYAKTDAGTYFSTQTTFTTASVTGLAIGQTYAGGVIFYLDSTLEHGLVYAPDDFGLIFWGCEGTTMGTGETLGNGPLNTTAIVSLCSQPGIAALLCDQLNVNGYSDWFLPSKEELNLLYRNIILNGLPSNLLTCCGGNSMYWTSSEDSNNPAWAQIVAFHVLGGGNYSWTRNNHANARAIRKF